MTISQYRLKSMNGMHHKGHVIARTAFSTLLIFLLSACTHLPPPPKEVFIPVPTACVKRDQLPVKDFLDDATLSKQNDYDLVISLRSEQLKQRVWIDQASALLTACVE